jgi:hypothetical protein
MEINIVAKKYYIYEYFLTSLYKNSSNWTKSVSHYYFHFKERMLKKWYLCMELIFTSFFQITNKYAQFILSVRAFELI